ncbi:MAG: hypothetical protein APF84_14620 [Gracilibacter sp. BRH_c7a]|nr:MAG: hypothetical protein APF84_14620 [Gracilibacter sp. BRH_c7a]
MVQRNRKKYNLRRFRNDYASTHALLEHIPEALFVVSPEGKYIEVNNAACQLLGYERIELLELTMMNVTPSHLYKETAMKFTDLKQKGKIFNEIVLKRKDGTELDAEIYGVALKDGNYLGTVRDITKRKEMERKLRESEETYRNLVEMSPDAIVVHCEGKVSFINQAGVSLYGVKDAQDMIGKEVINYVHPDFRSLAIKRITEILQNKKPAPFAYEKLFRADGSIAHVEIAAAPFQVNNNSIQVVVRDITERKEMEQRLKEKTYQLEEQLFLNNKYSKNLESIVEALQESKDKYKELFQNANDIIYTTDLEGKFLSLNQVGLKTYGYKPEEIISFDLTKIVHPDFVDLCLDYFQQKLSGSKDMTGPYEVLTVTKEGRKIWVEVSTRLIKKDQVPVGLQGIARDITERKQMIETIKKAEQEKDLILSSISEMVVFYDEEMKIRWANAMASEMRNASLDEMIGQYCYEIWHNSSSTCPNCPVKETLESGNKVSREIATPDGNIMQIKSFPVLDENHVIGAVEIAKDITERKRIENEMARLDRMNLIGEMAASFGHEIRNPMAVIRGFLQMLYDKNDLRFYRDHFEIMIEEVDRANSIITEYLSLAKNKVVDLRAQSLNSIIEVLYPLILADALHDDKSIELELMDIPSIVIDKNDIHQLILNLVRNGLEAMTKGGVVIIKTYQDDEEVVLEIKDAGKGIEPSIIPNLGMPFITTKENGTGIGLAICYSIADRNQAHIGFETSNKGTNFYVRFSIMKPIV